MRTDSFKGKDFMSLDAWKKEEIETILELAAKLKRNYSGLSRSYRDKSRQIRATHKRQSQNIQNTLFVLARS